MAERVVENLNHGLHELMARHPEAYLVGEDVGDPYGGAFRATRGLSDRFGDRVRGTPISEGALVGLAAGLAMTGRPVVAEIMFSDFATLAFDQLVNLAAKLPTMFGTPVRVPLTVRTATGAGRGYGATHSQSLQKHLLGVPNLSVHELTPFHDAGALLEHLCATGTPSLLFEDKILYTRRMAAVRDGVPAVFDDLFRVTLEGPAPGVARLAVPDMGDPECVVIAAGGTVHRAAEAARRLLVEEERVVEILVPAQLFPLDAGTLAGLAARADRVVVVDEGTAGAGWATEVAHELTRRLWGRLSRPVGVASSRSAVIPAAPHLEREVVVQAADVTRKLKEVLL